MRSIAKRAWAGLSLSLGLPTRLSLVPLRRSQLSSVPLTVASACVGLLFLALTQTVLAAERTDRHPSGATSAKANLQALVNQTARRHGVEPALVHAVVWAESAYNPKAVSHAGAIGLMQVMPATAADYGVSDASALFDPTVNVNTGVRHLKRLLRKYGHDYGRVIMAYNAGEGVVDRTNSNVTYAETLAYTEAVVRRYRKLGGMRPTDAVLRKVAMLRGNRGQPPQRQARQELPETPPTKTDSSLFLPKVSPALEVGNLISSVEPSTMPGSQTRAAVGVRQPAKAADRAVIRDGLRRGIDPAIRSPGRLGSVASPQAPGSAHSPGGVRR